jgi:hemerythrin-like domain-containing protein
LIGNFYDNVLKFLLVHHNGEDELVFPRLIARRPDDAAEIERVAAQHHDVDGALAGSGKALSDWMSGDSAAQPAVVDNLVELRDILVAHLDEEERVVLPMCGESLTPPEWGELPGHAMQAFEGDKIWLIMGLIRERFTQVQRDQMLAHMPPPAVEMWTGFGENAFNELMGAVGAPLR